jgi:peptidase M28-like protein
VAIPLLIAAFSVRKATPLPPPNLPPTFNTLDASEKAATLARAFPDRSPGANGAVGAAEWLVNQFKQEGFRTESDYWRAEIPGRGHVRLRNIVAIAPGRSPDAIVLMAHRDNPGVGPGADNNASGTAALLEIARGYANPAQGTGPGHTLIFLSTDAGSFGALGAQRFATHSPDRSRVLAVINLDSIAGSGRPSVQFAGDTPRSPPSNLLETAISSLGTQSGERVGHPSFVGQLLDLGFPFSLYEQAPLLGRGIPAVTLTTAGNRPPASLDDTPGSMDRKRLAQVGHAAQALLTSLDQGLELAGGTSSYLYLGPRYVPGWAIELILISALVPFLVAVVDLFAFCRRRRIAVVPGLRSYRRRLGFWAWVGGMFGLFALLGVWPGGEAAPVSPDTHAATQWPVLGLAAFGVLAGLGLLVARERLVPRGPADVEQLLAGQTAGLLALAVLSLLVAAVDPFALIFVLPSVHAWLWLSQLRGWPRFLTLLVGFGGLALLLASMAIRFDMGFGAVWYLAELVAVGYVPIPLVLIFLAWLACAGQFVALATGRYAPYPSRAERRRNPLLHTIGRRLVIRPRHRARAEREERKAQAGG